MTDYRRLVADFDRALLWLASIRIETANKRFSAYLQLLRELADAYDEGTVEALLDHCEPEELYDAIQQASELIRIRAGLEGESHPRFLHSLKTLVSGPTSSKNDRNSSHARDIGAELTVAAFLASLGFPLVWTSESDVETLIHDREIFIECKRPRSSRRTTGAARKAAKQLKERFDSARDPDSARGLIVMNIAYLENPASNLIAAQSITSLSDRLAGLTKQFLLEHQPMFEAERLDRRIIGVLVEFTCIAIVGGVITRAIEIALIDFPDCERDDSEILRSIESRFVLKQNAGRRLILAPGFPTL